MSAFDDLSDIGPQQLFAGYLARAVHGDDLTFGALDVFAPPREDWKALDAEEPRPPLWP